MQQKIFIDLDDTLIETADCYSIVLDKFVKHIQKFISADEEEILSLQEVYDMEFIKTASFVPERFPNSFVETYRFLNEKHNLNNDQRIEKELFELGWSVYEMIPSVKPEVFNVLSDLNKKAELNLYTLGEEFIQKPKIEKNGLDKFFRKIHIVSSKNSEVLNELLNCAPESAAMIGDSMKFDINPAAKLGLFSIHITANSDWKAAQEKPISNKIYFAENLLEANQILEDYFLI